MGGVGGMLLLLSLLLLLLFKYYPEKFFFECVPLKQTNQKNVPNRSDSDFKEEPDLKSNCRFTFLESVMSGS